MSQLKRPNLDSVTSVNQDGSQYRIHPADVHGRFTVARQIVAIVLLIIYVALPWIPINGSPAVFLDVVQRKFHVFGLTLIPQDLWVLFFGISGVGFSLFFLTALLGRVWCGWACPYTVLLEHVFRRMERWVMGNAVERRAFESAAWSPQKWAKTLLMEGLHFFVASLFALVFASYFLSVQGLGRLMLDGPLAHVGMFVFVTGLSVVLWFCFSRFREQFCIMMCPYGRLQSALSDDDTMIIGYDHQRGEPRGAKGKTTGACVDCRRCVQVCPTGIDIRHGLQLECIGCAACIDACDEVMDKLGRDRGLVRYDSLRGLEGKKRRWLRPRVYVYAILASCGMLALSLVARDRVKPYFVTWGRASGAAYFVDPAMVRNHFQYRFVNKRNQTARLQVHLNAAPANCILSTNDQWIEVAAQSEVKGMAVIMMPRASYTGPFELTLGIHAEPGGVNFEEKLHFLGPAANAHYTDATNSETKSD